MRARSTKVKALAHAAVAAAVGAALLLPAPARAEGEIAAAEALFEQARTLVEQKRWDEACPKFAASYKLDKTLGTLLNLADCEEHQTRIASAWAHWGEAVELAEKTGDKRAAFATGRRDALVKRLPKIRVDVTSAPTATATPGRVALEVYRDDVRVDPAAYGVPLPSDPGPHTLFVRRGADVLARKDVTAVEGETAAVSFDLAAIERAAPPPPTPPGALVAPLSNQKVVGYAVIGVGAATIAAAGALEIVALVNKSSANAPDSCVNDYCTQAGYDAVGRARTFANAGQWVGIGGIVVAAVGLTLTLTAPRPAPPTTRTGMALAPWVGPGAGGLVLRGVFR